MTIDKETRAEILRLYHVEKWTVGTITRQLGVHRYTVERLLTAAGEPRDARSPRPSMIDPYVPFISVWGAAGYGQGTLTLDPEGEGAGTIRDGVSLTPRRELRPGAAVRDHAPAQPGGLSEVPRPLPGRLDPPEIRRAR